MNNKLYILYIGILIFPYILIKHTYVFTEEDIIFGFVLWFRPFENTTTGQRVFLEALYVSKPYRQKYVEQALFEQTIQIY